MMRVYLVIDETVFFHPQFLEEFIQKCKDDVVGASLVTAVKRKNNIERYMMEHFYYLKPIELYKLGKAWAYYKIKSVFDPQGCYTVKQVLNRHSISYEIVKYNINVPKHLNYIKSKRPDVIISSQSLYFGKRLLSIPKLCCINRHSGLLPRNGGLWPGFQALRKGETETGVSVHTMEKTIDAGIVLSQLKFNIDSGDTVWDVYKECFDRSAEAVLIALDKIRNNDYTAVVNGFNREYYSFPSRNHWHEFRKRGRRYY